MKKTILGLFALALASCSTQGDFKITNTSIGPLSSESAVTELKTLFVNDSLVDQTLSSDFTVPKGAVTVYEKGGKKLLLLTPKTTESDATIGQIQVFDNRYTTPEGVHLGSTFKDISDNYTINRVENLFNTIVVFVDESDVFFSIDKKNLPGEVRFDVDAKIELSQIPDDAPIKYLQMIWE